MTSMIIFIGYEGILRDITERRMRRRQSRQFKKKLMEEIILAEERERRALGQALHEDLAQNLALVQMKIQQTVAEIGKKLRGRPLASHEIIVNLIAKTTTEAGLKINAMLD